MALSMLSLQCRGVDLPGPLGSRLHSDPEHDRCPGGFTREGVLGGWICSCDCHRVPDGHQTEEQ